MRSADLNQAGLPNRWGKFQDLILITAFASASALAMFGWLTALGWIAVQTADWLFALS